MSEFEMFHLDGEQGGGGHRRSAAGSDDVSVCFSEAEDGSCYSFFYSTAGDGDCGLDWVSDLEGGCDSRRSSSASSSCYSVEAVGAQSRVGAPEIKVHLTGAERDCRICHLSLESVSHESGIPIELGCSCKDDLAAAHQHCAEAWFRIRGNKTCEICNSIARNVVGVIEVEAVQPSGVMNNAATPEMNPVGVAQADDGGFWHGHRFLNFLLACMVFAFVISWLFHFNVPS